MKEIFSPSSKAKANRYGKLPPFSNGVPAPSHGSSSAMPLRYIPAITCLTKLKNERINVTANPIGDQDSKPTLFGAMSKNAFAGDGPQSLSPEDWLSNTLNSPLAHLILSLVRAHRKRKHRGYSRKHKTSHIPERISIQERPQAVLKRHDIGHWETDTISCRKSYQAVQVTVERKARYAKMAKLKTKSARAMSIALTRRLSRYPTNLRLSITYDNGSENAEHLRTNKILGTCSYFCQPFHSYERGTVENTIGLVRRFLPKKTNLAKISQDHLVKIEYWLNHRPRKCLGFKTPAEVFKAECCT